MARRLIINASDRTAYGQAVLRGRERMAAGLKVCRKCGEERPRYDFGAGPGASECSACAMADAVVPPMPERTVRPSAYDRRAADRPYDGPVLVAGRSTAPPAPIACTACEGWPIHLLPFMDMVPIDVLTDEAVANGYAMADAAAPLPRGWTPAPVCVLRGDDGGGGA